MTRKLTPAISETGQMTESENIAQLISCSMLVFPSNSVSIQKSLSSTLFTVYLYPVIWLEKCQYTQY